jgi:hypothetical protein
MDPTAAIGLSAPVLPHDFEHWCSLFYPSLHFFSALALIFWSPPSVTRRSPTRSQALWAWSGHCLDNITRCRADCFF